MEEQRSSIQPSRHLLDQLGIGVAGFCALHCIATVVLVSGLGVGTHFLLEPAIHEIGLLLAFLIALVAISWGAFRHRRPGPILVAFVGLGFMGAALTVGHGNEEFVLTLIGVSLVAAGHLLNIRNLRLPRSI